MKVYIKKMFKKQLNRLAQGFPKLMGIAILLALLLLPASSAMAGVLAQTPGTATIKVVKYHDLNGDGIRQSPSEPDLPNWTFELYLQVSGQWVFQSSGTTDQTGHLYFYDLQPGTYRVVEQTQVEWTNTTSLTQTAILVADQFKIMYFGNILRPSDFGDLPDNYNMTTRAQNGARHQPGSIYLGTAVDTESDGIPTPFATGDNLVGADEDGILPVANPPDYWTQGQGTVQVTVTGGVGCLFAWVDAWDSAAGAPGTDGDFTDSGPGWSEAIVVNQPVNPGSQLVSFALPQGAATYPLWARFRIVDSYAGDCSYYDTNPVTTHGFIESGEVEDYYFSFTPTAVSLQTFTAQAGGMNNNLFGLAAVLIISAGLLMVRRRMVHLQQPGS
jgi:hypothetical protein